MKNKTARYKRIEEQIKQLVTNVKNPQSRMATIVAILHHKMDHFFWTGFYLLAQEELEVSCYQGPLACMRLKKNTGVCWASVNQKKSIFVSDVSDFPGHIACSSLSQSEIVIPVWKNNKVLGCLDIDSRSLNSFDREDAECLESIVNIVFNS